MVVACDTSFLFSLYGSDAFSPRAVAWALQATTPVYLTSLVHYEFGNALRFAEFRGALQPGEAARHWAGFEAAIVQGRLVLKTCNLADIVNEANRISATHTLTDGYRAFDILHVAAALMLQSSQLLTFDARQKALAEKEGLLVPI